MIPQWLSKGTSATLTVSPNLNFMVGLRVYELPTVGIRAPVRKLEKPFVNPRVYSLDMKLLSGLVVLALTDPCLAQQPRAIPSVADLVKEIDGNGDGKISRAEAEKSPRTKRQFPRWDSNEDGMATTAEIIAMRRKYGIGPDGKRLGDGPPRDREASPIELTLPSINELTRLKDGRRPTREERKWSLALLHTEPHAVSDGGYVILTDHTEDAWLEPLRKLADHRRATILKVADLGTVFLGDQERKALHNNLSRLRPRFVAIAPRLESYREKMLIGCFKLLSTFDEDPELDAFPGLLVAPDAGSFAKLIAKSIEHRPQSSEQFRALFQCHFTGKNADGLRSLQKVGMLRAHFSNLGHETAGLVVAAPKVRDDKPLKGENLVYTTPKEGRLLQQFAGDARKQLADASLIVMFGHGSPGMSCGFKVEAFHDLVLDGKIVMAGSCWSAAPRELDFPMPNRDAAGTQLQAERERFLMRAVQNGAVVSFGHMRLSQGFSTLYPVLEAWMGGVTVGEGYQRLINAILHTEKSTILDDVLALDPKKLKEEDGDRRSPAIPGNRLLYVIVGDPALQPFEKLRERN